MKITVVKLDDPNTNALLIRLNSSDRGLVVGNQVAIELDYCGIYDFPVASVTTINDNGSLSVIIELDKDIPDGVTGECEVTEVIWRDTAVQRLDLIHLVSEGLPKDNVNQNREVIQGNNDESYRSV